MATKKPAAKSKSKPTKKPAAKAKKPAPKKAAAKSKPAKKPALATKPKASDLPTAADGTFVASAKPGPADGKSPPKEMAYLFTEDAVRRLTAPAVVAFLGSGYQADSLLADAAEATTAAAARDRFQNAADSADRAYVAPASRLQARLRLLMERFDDLLAANPSEAAALQEIRDWWQSHHTSGPHKPKDPPK
jgi:outer membrane biosynthesis protein TonB